MPVIVLTLEPDGQPLAVDCCDNRFDPVHGGGPHKGQLGILDHQTGLVVQVRETLDELQILVQQAHAADGELRARKQR